MCRTSARIIILFYSIIDGKVSKHKILPKLSISLNQILKYTNMHECIVFNTSCCASAIVTSHLKKGIADNIQMYPYLMLL